MLLSPLTTSNLEDMDASSLLDVSSDLRNSSDSNKNTESLSQNVIKCLGIVTAKQGRAECHHLNKWLCIVLFTGLGIGDREVYQGILITLALLVAYLIMMHYATNEMFNLLFVVCYIEF